MSESTKELVSALIDGELESNAESTLDSFLASGELQSTWSRYHMIGDSMRDVLPASIDKKLASRISAGVREEPHLLIPAQENNIAFLKPIAGFAIAASVAAMAILGIQQNSPERQVPQQSIAAVAPSPQLNTAVVPHQAASAGESPSELQLRRVKMDARARMNSYLVNYSEYRTNSGFQGILPYARTVSFENNRQGQ